MSRILFGEKFLDDHVVCMSLINANSPLVWDSTMLGAAETYAEANQAVIITPFILSGAMSPVTVAGTLAQVLAEVMAGTAFVQLVRPGAPVVFGTFVSTLSMQSGAPTFGTPEAALAIYGAGQLARRMKMPFRTGGSLCASKVPDAQAAYESAQTLVPTLHAGANFVLHAAGWMEGGLASSYEKFVMDTDQLGMMHVLAKGIDLSENGQAMEAFRQVGPGGHFLGCDHTQANFEQAFYRSFVADNNSVEQWEAEGRLDEAAARQRASGRRCSPSTRPRRSTRASTRRSATSSSGRRPRCPTPRTEVGRLPAPLRQPRQPLGEERVEALVVGAAEVEHVLRPVGDPPVVGDGHAAGELAHRLDGDVDLPPVEQLRLEQPGDDAGVVERRALAAVFLEVEALGEVEHLRRPPCRPCCRSSRSLRGGATG